MIAAHKKFLQFSNSIRHINRRYKLHDPKAVMVLEAVLLAYADQTTLTVLDLILLKEIASQATLHSVMKTLIENKLIKTETSKEDGRRKLVFPMKLGSLGSKIAPKSCMLLHVSELLKLISLALLDISLD